MPLMLEDLTYLQATMHEVDMASRHMKARDLAIMLRWQILPPRAITAKARDFAQLLSTANEQLPADKPRIVHIGFEVIEGDEGERARFEEIFAGTRRFDPRGKPLEYVFCDYPRPKAQKIRRGLSGEMVQCIRIGEPLRKAPYIPFVVLPPNEAVREEPHWQV